MLPATTSETKYAPLRFKFDTHDSMISSC